jgi:hypothetical protein
LSPQSLQKPLVNISKSAIGHNQDNIFGFKFQGKKIDNLARVIEMMRRSAPFANIFGQTFG